MAKTKKKKKNKDERKEVMCCMCEFLDKNGNCTRLNFENVLKYQISECGDYLIKENRMFF